MRVGEAVWGSGAVFELSLRNNYKSQACRETFIPAFRFRVWKDFAVYFLFPTTKTRRPTTDLALKERSFDPLISINSRGVLDFYFVRIMKTYQIPE